MWTSGRHLRTTHHRKWALNRQLPASRCGCWHMSIEHRRLRTVAGILPTEPVFGWTFYCYESEKVCKRMRYESTAVGFYYHNLVPIRLQWVGSLGRRIWHRRSVGWNEKRHNYWMIILILNGLRKVMARRWILMIKIGADICVVCSTSTATSRNKFVTSFGSVYSVLAYNFTMISLFHSLSSARIAHRSSRTVRWLSMNWFERHTGSGGECERVVRSSTI